MVGGEGTGETIEEEGLTGLAVGQMAGNHPVGAAEEERGLGGVLGSEGGAIEAGLGGADDKDAFGGELGKVTEVAGVEDGAGEEVGVLDGGEIGAGEDAIADGNEIEVVRGGLAGVVGGEGEAGAAGGAIHEGDPGGEVEVRAKREFAGIEIEIIADLLGGGIFVGGGGVG